MNAYICDTCDSRIIAPGGSVYPEGWYAVSIRLSSTVFRQQHFCCPACVLRAIHDDILVASNALEIRVCSDPSTEPEAVQS